MSAQDLSHGVQPEMRGSSALDSADPGNATSDDTVALYSAPLLYRYTLTYKYPFGKIIGLDELSPAKQEAYFVRHHNRPTFIYSKELIARRRSAAKKMRQRFIELGGVPTTSEPYYFTLGPADDFFYGERSYNGSLAIPLREFDTRTVSFTYGDSVPLFDTRSWDEQSPNERLYTVDNLDELLMMSRGLREGVSGPPFIEAQVWSSDVVSTFCPHVKVESLDMAVRQVDHVSKAILLAGPKFTRSNAWPGLSFAALLRATRKSEYLRWCLQHADEGLYFSSPVHGFAHCFNTALYATYMMHEQHEKNIESRAATLSALYHDVGRIAEGVDSEHGRASADVMAERIVGEDPQVLAIARAAAHAHCVSLRNVDKVLLQYVSKDLLPSARRVAATVRTADTLDYIRFGTATYHPMLIEPSQHTNLIRPALGLTIMLLWYPEAYDDLVRSYL